MNTYLALVKREVLDGKNGYIRVPIILAGLTVAMVILSSLGVGELNLIRDIDHHEVHNIGDALNLAQQEEAADLPAAVTAGYWVISALMWVSFPFVIFFSLLSTLYEERRDRSILFWKSMPVDDWQEVAAKLFTIVLVTPVIFLCVAIAAQLVSALFLSIVVLFQGGPVLALWPLGFMISSWFSMLGHYILWALWALPVLAWVLFVSAYASRLPFMWAILTPVVIIIAEGTFLETHVFAEWLGRQLGGWQEWALDDLGRGMDIRGPRDALNMVFGAAQWEALKFSLSSMRFWSGLVIAGGFVYGAIELRKRGT